MTLTNRWCAFTQVICAIYASIEFSSPRKDFLHVLGANGGGCLQRQDRGDAFSFFFFFFFYKKNSKVKKNFTNLTWISWILLKPSLQKNSNKLETVPGPGISARVFGDFFAAASFDVISLSGMDSSPAIPTVRLVVDLCKQRKPKSICLLRLLPWTFLQHCVVNLIMTIISRRFQEKI